MLDIVERLRREIDCPVSCNCSFPADECPAIIAAAAADEIEKLRAGWLRTIQVENSCEMTGHPCNAKRCGCQAEQDTLKKEESNDLP